MPSNSKTSLAVLLAFAFVTASCANSSSAGANNFEAEPMDNATRQAEQARVETVIDALHSAAAAADGERYFALFASDATFIGTDASEHWTLAEFREYANPIFARGQGWSYTPHDRRVQFTADGSVAWFDEQLTNAKYGELRGSGLLARDADDRWLIQQYVLSFTVPNDASARVVEVISTPR